MELSIDRKELLKCMNLLIRVAPEESVITALTGILMEADSSGCELTLTATNLTSALRIRLPAAVKEGGAAIVNARMAAEYLKRCSENPVHIQCGSHGACIRTGQSRLDLPMLPAEEFPDTGGLLDESAPAVLACADWQSVLSKPLFCASHTAAEDSQTLTCVRLSMRDGVLQCLCCDGGQAFSLQRKGEWEGTFHVLLPAAAVSLFCGLAGNGEELSLHIGKETVQFRRENFFFSARQVRQVFPPVDALVSGMKRVYSALVKATELREALDLSAAIGASAVNLSITGEGLRVRPCSEQVKSMLPIIQAEKCRPTPEAGFYYRTARLMQGVQTMRSLGGETLSLWMTEAGVLMLELPGCYYMQPASRPPKVKKIVREEKQKEAALKAA